MSRIVSRFVGPKLSYARVIPLASTVPVETSSSSRAWDSPDEAHPAVSTTAAAIIANAFTSPPTLCLVGKEHLVHPNVE